MSMTEESLHKCTSCGHQIGRGRLTCQNCGAPSSTNSVIVGNIMAYKNIWIQASEEYYKALRYMDKLAVLSDRVLGGSDITLETQISDIKTFWNLVGEIWKEGRYEEAPVLRENTRLFKTHHKIDDKISFNRYTAICDGVIYVCEVESGAYEYLQKETEVYRLEERLSRGKRDLGDYHKKIDDITDSISKINIELSGCNLELEELEIDLAVWRDSSWFAKKKTVKPDTTKFVDKFKNLTSLFDTKTNTLVYTEEKRDQLIKSIERMEGELR